MKRSKIITAAMLISCISIISTIGVVKAVTKVKSVPKTISNVKTTSDKKTIKKPVKKVKTLNISKQDNFIYAAFIIADPKKKILKSSDTKKDLKANFSGYTYEYDMINGPRNMQITLDKENGERIVDLTYLTRRLEDEYDDYVLKCLNIFDKADDGKSNGSIIVLGCDEKYADHFYSDVNGISCDVECCTAGNGYEMINIRMIKEY